MIELHNDDCLNILPKIKSDSIDLIVTDCPYKVVSGGRTGPKSPQGGIFSEKNGNIAAGKIFDHNEITFKEWVPEIYRVLKSNSHCYIMINGRNLSELQIECEKVGFEFQNLLVWKKDNVTPNRYYMQCLEFILLLRKGKARSINNMGASNFFNYPNVKDKMHPTQKPIELMRDFIINSSSEGDIVLDPFMGYGSTGIAAIANNRKFIGIEIDEKYFQLARNEMPLAEDLL